MTALPLAPACCWSRSRRSRQLPQTKPWPRPARIQLSASTQTRPTSAAWPRRTLAGTCRPAKANTALLQDKLSPPTFGKAAISFSPVDQEAQQRYDWSVGSCLGYHPGSSRAARPNPTQQSAPPEWRGKLGGTAVQDRPSECTNVVPSLGRFLFYKPISLPWKNETIAS
ncbi:MAG: hypothetical protein JWL87_734 [Candidatus Adlerbacteria bacterium]|nr:hypothetical protein [Candidatus Adlerbacteria bacterium]